MAAQLLSALVYVRFPPYIVRHLNFPAVLMSAKQYPYPPHTLPLLLRHLGRYDKGLHDDLW